MTLSESAHAVSSAAAELRRGPSAVRVAVGPGAPITSFVSAEREWCADGAWQDYAPTFGACALPTYVSGAAGARFPNGGLLAADEPTVDVQADGGAGSITTWWPPSPYPLGWTRTITLDADGTLCVRYTVTNAQRAPLPFVWGIPIGIPWNASVKIDLPRGARSRVAASRGGGLVAAGTEFAWPAVRDGGRLVDLSRPTELPPHRSVACFVELARGRFSVRSGDLILDIAGDPGVVTHARVFVNNDSDTPETRRRRWWGRHVAQCALTVGPAVGAPDLLSDAVGAWRAARWVEPGETIKWDVRYRVSPVPTT